MYGFVETTKSPEKTAMSIQTMFNNNNLDKLLTDDDGSFTTLTVSGRSNTNRRINILDVPGMDGAHEDDSPTIEPREIIVKFKLSDLTNEGFRDRFNRLNSLLNGVKKVLEFTDEKSHFYSTASKLDIPEEETNNLVGTITFFCSNPYKYGEEKSFMLLDTSVVNNEGTTKSDPIFELIATKKATFAMVSKNAEDYNMIGIPDNVDTEKFEREQLILHDKCTSLSGWSTATSVDNGDVTGNMKVEDGGFVVNSVGSILSPHRWQGPAMRRPIGASLTNFRMKAEVELLNIGKEIGMIEFYLLASNGDIVMKIGVEDVWQGIEKVQAKFQIDPTDPNIDRIQHYVEADRPTAWNNFRGVLQIFRDDGKLRPYFALITPNGTHDWVSSATYFGSGDNREISHVQVALRVFGNATIANMKIKDIKFWRYNKEEGIPYIINQGDIITFDHRNDDILINGEAKNDLKNFGGTFFKLDKGYNSIAVSPTDTFQTNVRFRDKHL